MAQALKASRFAGLGRAQAIGVVLALLAVLAATVWATMAQAPAAPSGPAAVSTADDQDLVVYRKINARVASGEGYYSAAAAELRRGNYPLKPFFVFRLPTLPWMSAAAGPAGMPVMLWLTFTAMLVAWWRRLENAFEDWPGRFMAVLLVGAGGSVALNAHLAVVHEVWAGLLIAISIAIHREKSWIPSVAIAAAAVFVRELALPFVLLMGAFALWGRRWREFAAWTALVIAFALAIGLHAMEVGRVVSAADPLSPGWRGFGGWPTFLRTMQLTSALRVFPDTLSAAGVVLALFGWSSWRGPGGLFGTLLIAGYGLMFMLFARPDNFYWGLLLAPLFALGLAFLPRAFADLLGAIAKPRPQLDLALR